MMKKVIKTAMAASVALAAQTSFAAPYTNSFDVVGAEATMKSVQTKNALGVGAVYSEEIYKGVDDVTRAVPLIRFNYNSFYFRGFELGYDAYRSERLDFAAVIKPMFNGYEADDSDDLTGMDDRKISAYAGGQMTYKVKPVKFIMFLAQDITGRTSGTEAGLKIASGLPLLDGKMIVSPFVTATYWSSDIVDYYYGVKSSEATNSRAEYSGDSTVNYGAGVSGFYQFNPNWRANLTYQYTMYGDEVTDSPIVEDDNSSVVLLGLSYVFA